jgi:NADH:quinone reductase (non-electrogenic)
VIGRAAAVANVFGVKLSGLPTWLVWAFIHLMYIVEFRSRVLVFILWAFQDLTFNRGTRLNTGSSTTDLISIRKWQLNAPMLRSIWNSGLMP